VSVSDGKIMSISVMSRGEEWSKVGKNIFIAPLENRLIVIIFRIDRLDVISKKRRNIHEHQQTCTMELVQQGTGTGRKNTPCSEDGHADI
jgi:hypothetical protein